MNEMFSQNARETHREERIRDGTGCTAKRPTWIIHLDEFIYLFFLIETNIRNSQLLLFKTFIFLHLEAIN